ncbi:ATP-binding cassette subfamily B multidrug efflux pump [Rhodopseudomonas julia]|uniref:ATP-binding cassette subfamily B multidrug efflux pump n=1 Tax=Rhodopseudomonas julia TaxID=200617 RepID=A0ABU0CAG1_9BRAD|nr:ABC transporter ATP-binding protein [Rhodopseudomonas julia]MDQ0327523.1 ATP-binding cassette subfamily B multidrug efflux pump [Rhodopseudomonas julia]
MFRFFERLIDPLRPESAQPPATTMAFIWHYARQMGWPLAALLATGLGSAVTDAVVFSFIGRLVDMIGSANRETFWSDHGLTLLGMALVVLVLRPAFVIANSLLSEQSVAPNFANLVRWQSYRHVLRQSVSFFANDFAGRIANKVMQTGISLADFVTGLAETLWTVLVFAITALVLLGQADLRLMLPVIVWLGGYVVLAYVMIPRLRGAAKRVSNERSIVNGRIVDSYTNIQTVKLFAEAETEESFVRQAIGSFVERLRILTRQVTTIRAVLTMLNACLVVSIAVTSLWLWQANAITVGAIATGLALATRLSTMAGWVMFQLSALFRHIGIVQDGLETISRPHEVLDQPGARDLAVTGGEISFENIRFHYGRGGGVIEDLSLHVRPGERLGLVGVSGAGKSTLMSLLLRFYDLEGGRILIDGQDISQVTQSSLRAAIGVVTQDTALLHRSVRDNIVYGRPDADEDQYEEAARAAEAAEFIDNLSDHRGRSGYDALVGERGVKLSGGQRQRIAIARVLLKNAPILVLDEATSALDSEAEAAIQENLERLMQGKTVIAIAHRLSTIAAMDRLVVLERGQIVEAGTHQTLLQKNGVYSKLWERQSGGFLAPREISIDVA